MYEEQDLREEQELEEEQELREKLQEVDNMTNFILYRCEGLMANEDVSPLHKLLAAFFHLLMQAVISINSKIHDAMDDDDLT